ncbi:hypothetical protein AB0873_32335 [Micromonospora sp. NPDC047707]|uniref:hypothetical protein n=1 Tax=Micromonospora sp. NPDC047707 TaxID=3154498 RepID=UPI0034569413
MCLKALWLLSLFLYRHKPPSYVLELLPSDREAAREVFVQQGQPEDDWFTVAGLATRAAAPDIFEKLKSAEYGGSERLALANYGFDYAMGEFDPSFAIMAGEDDLNDLIRLGVLLRDLYHDHKRLAGLIKSDPGSIRRRLVLMCVGFGAHKRSPTILQISPSRNPPRRTLGRAYGPRLVKVAVMSGPPIEGSPHVWARDMRRLIEARRYREAEEVLREAALSDPQAARELGHLLLQVSWEDTPPTGFSPGGASPAEKWLRRAVSERPDDVRAMVLLAGLLMSQCDQILDVVATWSMPDDRWEDDDDLEDDDDEIDDWNDPDPVSGPDSAQYAAEIRAWESDLSRRADQARHWYQQALTFDPGCGSAASGLAFLLSQATSWLPDTDRSSVTASAKRALEINPVEPVAMWVLAEATGDDRLRQRAEALSPRIPQPKWRPASAGGTVTPFGHGELSRYSYIVAETQVMISNSGDSVTRYAVLRDLEQARWFSRRCNLMQDAVMHVYERGILTTRHRAVMGKDIAQILDEQPAETFTGESLPAGHPVRHDGVPLHYGINGAWMAD